MKRLDPDLAWALLIAAGVAYEVQAIRNEQWDHTASRTTRRWWRTHTRPGQVAFAVGWLGFAAWFTHHVIEGSNT